MNIVDVVITPVSPLHISEPGAAYYNPDTQHWGKVPGSFPTTRTKRIRLAKSNNAPNGNAEERTTLATEVPYIPGNGLRGALRRAAAQEIFAQLKARGETIKLDLYHVILCGAASASPDKSATVTESAEAARHPFAGLFGGGPKMIWSRLAVGNGFPIVPDTLELGVVAPGMAEKAVNVYPMTMVPMETRVDDILRGTAAPVGIIADAEKEIAGWISKLADSRAKRDSAEDNDSKKVGLATVSGKEIVIPGLPFHSEHRLDLDLPGEAALGLYIIGLANFANGQRLGGGWREGFGRFILQAAMRGEGAEAIPLLSAVDGVYVPNTSHPAVAGAIEAWKSFAPTLTAAQLTKVFSL